MSGGKDTATLFKEISSIITSELCPGITFSEIDNLYIYEREEFMNILKEKQKAKDKQHKDAEKDAKRATKKVKSGKKIK